MPVNAHKLFYARLESGSLHSRLKPDEATEQRLRAAKNLLRGALARGIPVWLSTHLNEEAKAQPRFMTQGSWSYDTCNLPCQTPPQEMDWDLGIYLPVDAWEDNAVEPRHAAAAFYRMVEQIVAPVAQAKGWTLSRKETCVRVNLTGETAHIDLPLYVAPAKEFQTIQEHVARKALGQPWALDSATLADAQQDWDDLRHISLALRDGTWRRSDPRAVAKWFEKKRLRHPSLRRLCRYLKAWRDHTWDSGGPSSIVLMICAAQALDTATKSLDNRDDLALLHVTQSLADRLGGDIKEASIDPGEQFNRLDPGARRDAAQRARTLQGGLRSAILHASPQEAHQVILRLRELWGARVPMRPDWIACDASDAHAVRSIAPAVVSQPVIRPTRAG